MSWILEQLVETILKWVVAVINQLLEAFGSVNFDIGYRGENGELTGFFDQILPMANWPGIFTLIGGLLATAIAITKLIQAIISREGAQDPKRTFVDFGISLVLVLSSYSIFVLFENAVSYICGYTGIVIGFGQKEIVLPSNFESQMFADTPNEAIGFAKTVIVLIFMFALLVQFVRMLFEFYTRYIMIGAFFYLSPLACSMYTSRSSNKVFSNFVQAIITTSLLLILDLFILKVFVTGMGNVFTLSETEKLIVMDDGNGGVFTTYMTVGTYFKNLGDFIIKMTLLIGWLYIGTNMDKYFRDIGLAAPQSGGGLGGALLMGSGAAIGTLRLAAKAAEKVAKITSGAIGKLGKSELTSDPGAAEMNSALGSPDKYAIQNNEANYVAGTRQLKPEAKYAVVGLDGGHPEQVIDGSAASSLLGYVGCEPNSQQTKFLKDYMDDCGLNEWVASDGKLVGHDANGNEVLSIYNDSWGDAGVGGRIPISVSEHGDVFSVNATKDLIDKDTYNTLAFVESSRDAFGISKDSSVEVAESGVIKVVDTSGSTEMYIGNSGYSDFSKLEGVKERQFVPAGESSPGTYYEVVTVNPDIGFSGSVAPRVAKDAHSTSKRYTQDNREDSIDLAKNMRENVKSTDSGSRSGSGKGRNGGARKKK